MYRTRITSLSRQFCMHYQEIDYWIANMMYSKVFISPTLTCFHFSGLRTTCFQTSKPQFVFKCFVNIFYDWFVLFLLSVHFKFCQLKIFVQGRHTWLTRFNRYLSFQYWYDPLIYRFGNQYAICISDLNMDFSVRLKEFPVTTGLKYLRTIVGIIFSTVTESVYCLQS